MQNCAMGNGALGVRLRDDADDDPAVRSSELLVEEAPVADGLVEAGRSGRDVTVRLGGNEL
jgi:hypothetical protein